jgi:hypothetical protein
VLAMMDEELLAQVAQLLRARNGIEADLARITGRPASTGHLGRGLQVDGEMLVHDTTVTRIELTGARLRNPGGLALSAGGLTVTGGMFCSGGFTAHGGVWLVGAPGSQPQLRQVRAHQPRENSAEAGPGDHRRL